MKGHSDFNGTLFIQQLVEKNLMFMKSLLGSTDLSLTLSTSMGKIIPTPGSFTSLNWLDDKMTTALFTVDHS